ncbi:hypothetical protein BCR43DRAFT_498450 [Syncephalastrum racemosum]|uniref:Rieske domain-containing protein n=1 Tax=Syncephalastrum racemosum TaxID=13706 RepID=A0A1X2H0W2_SYNRA|nr:hypothetical protein BCR43DRAFT_498450 [Syncephalastrum racemosum]
MPGAAGGNGPPSLPDSMRASTLLEQIGCERAWSQDQIEADLNVLDKNRLYFLRDLRALSNQSWLLLDLLPLVRDLLREAIDPGWESKLHAAEKEVKKKKDKKDKKMKKDKKDKKDRKKYVLGEPVIPMTLPPSSMMDLEDDVSQDPETVRNTIRNGSIDVGKSEMLTHPLSNGTNGSQNSSSSSKLPKKSVSFDDHTEEITDADTKKGIPSSDSSMMSSSSDDTTASSDNDSGERDRARTAFAQQRPFIHSTRPIQPINNRRIRVRTASGTTYECDRLCPHKGVDLSAWGQVRGNTLVCTKHNWTFPLESGGIGPSGRSVNPCQVNDW